MPHSRRYLMVHGHFYQPPRENPWTGRIEPQPTAAPWPDWNARIAAECYLPMARARVRNAGDRIVDLYNNYAHASFNFGPTLLAWLTEEAPGLPGHLRDAMAMNRTSALAQAYGHPMLPLADVRDRHTQILWGLKEFKRRFGFIPEGMWLPECGIDRETVRALVDHKVKFVILSPHQASQARPFGEAEWRDASMGGIDTRRAYRLFETDGGGRTHFDRHLDVIFYTPGLNLKVSFEHILGRPEDLAREIEACYDPGRFESQLVSIVTDGEIYGHHEKRGEEALARLFTKIAPSLRVKVCTAGDFLRDNPPSWEVRLWDGEDGNGTSWSCRHGMGRWSRDCGCSSGQHHDWNQGWRRPLRSAFDDLRDKIRATVRLELGRLLWDVDDARDDYIAVVLDPEAASRRAFLARHAQRRLTEEETRAVWRLLEADRNAMFMYASCGWFFDDLSGLEPVQNMRYALRAAELAQPFREDDLAAALADRLSVAKSNLPRHKDGGDIFRRLVLPTRYTDRQLVAALAMCLAAGLPAGGLSWRLVAQGGMERRDDGGRRLAWGSFVCRDAALDRFLAVVWLADLSNLESAGVLLLSVEERRAGPGAAPDASAAEAASGFAADRLRQAIASEGVALEAMPAAAREGVYRLFETGGEQAFLDKAADLGGEAAALMRRAGRYGAAVPDAVRSAAVLHVERGIEKTVIMAIAGRSFSDAELGQALSIRRTAEELDFWASQDRPARFLALALREYIHWLRSLPEPGWLDSLPEIELSDGTPWIAPSDRLNRRLVSSLPEGFARALGTGLAAWRRELPAGAGRQTAALATAPVPEILAFARQGGFVFPDAAGVDREFWDFLSLPLSRLIREDPAGILAGLCGDRLRRAGAELGFSEEAVDKRLLEAARLAVTGGR